MSSTRMQVVPATSPMTFITSESPARSRRLSMMASGALMRFASPRARTTPPTSGETTVMFAPLKRSLMSRTITGEANRLSVGMSKNPWICPACRSTVSTRSAPELVIRFATSLAEIGVGPGGAEIGHHRRDAPRRRTPQRVHDDQQLHQVIVRRERGRLQHVDVRAAHVLLDLDEDLHVGEAPHIRSEERRVGKECRSRWS